METPAFYGDAVKALDENGKVGGYLVRFSDETTPDLTGDYFNKSTDFGEISRLPVIYQHGMDKVLKSRKIGRAELTLDDVGIWAEAQLELRDEYERTIFGLAKSGKLGWSSGAASHVVDREHTGKAAWIKQWYMAEASLTPTPAEPQNMVVTLKSMGDNTLDDEAKGGHAQTEAQESKGANIQIVEKGVSQMSENVSQTPTPEYKALEDKISALSGGLEKVLKFMEDTPAVMNSGVVSQDGGTADSNIKSFGDFLFAVKRGDHSRLAKIYGATKALNEDQGSAGGYVVPSSFSTDLMNIATAASPILGLVKRTPVTAPSGSIPALDLFVAPTAGSGNTAMAGKVTSAKRAEGGAFTATQPQFVEIKYRLNDVASGYVPVTKEFQADTPLSLESLLTSLFGIAVAAKQEYYILRGNGAAEPLGILNAPAAIGIAPDTNNSFAYADAVEMASRFKQLTGNVRWVSHQSIMPDYAGSGWVQGQVVRSLDDLGYGAAILSEHLPQADNSGCVLLADFGAYMLFEKGGLEISYSEHADFLNGNNVWRFSQRMDGQPWLKNVITQADPQGSFTVSPFVYLND